MVEVFLNFRKFAEKSAQEIKSWSGLNIASKHHTEIFRTYSLLTVELTPLRIINYHVHKIEVTLQA